MHTISYRSLWAGQTLANLGDVFYIVVLISLIYQATGKASYAALVPLFIVTAQSISGMVAPLLFARHSLRNVLLTMQFAKTLLLLALTLFTSYGLGTSTWFVLLGLAFLIAFLDGWMTPARNALLPQLVAESHLVKANSLFATTDQTVQLLGWAFGALLVASIGGDRVLWITLVAYLLATCLTLFIKSPQKIDRSSKEGASKWHVIRAGWVIIWQSPLLRTLTWMELIEIIANGVWIGALLLVYVHEVLAVGVAWWGYINAVYLVGMILGGLLVMALAEHVTKHFGASILLGSACYGLLTLGFALTTTPWLALLYCLLMGPVYSLRDIAQRTLFQTHVEPSALPHVFSAKATMFAATFGVSVVLMSQIADRFGVRSVYLFSAVLIGCSVWIAIWKRKILLR